MQETKNKIGSHIQELKRKERHIVSWSQQEDDILRQQIKLHGTENWSVIASKFEDKTTRQCRRRWYTYLNSDFKRGGWSPEEDLLLCEAQKIFGNRWTEIAKVVSGRTDNAVKNRFSTLCKKKAKYEALVAKENTIYNINANNKRVLNQTEFIADGSSETSFSKDKIRRKSKSDINENCNLDDGLHKQDETRMDQQIRAPLAVLIENLKSVTGFPVQDHSNDAKNILNNDKSNNLQGAFLKKDNSKISALLQQTELLSSLGLQVQTENTDQSLENAWKVLKNFLYNSKYIEALRHKFPDIDLQLEDIKDFMEDLRSRYGGNRWRQHDQHESPSSSECSSGSNSPSQTAEEQIKIEQTQTEEDTLDQDINSGHHSDIIGECNSIDECEKGTPSGANAKQVEIFLCCDEQSNKDAVTSSCTEFSSPLQVTPMFRSLAAGIPSPEFSESERNFLLKTLGLESPIPYPSSNTSQPPSCKRVLLQTTSALSFSMRRVLICVPRSMMKNVMISECNYASAARPCLGLQHILEEAEEKLPLLSGVKNYRIRSSETGELELVVRRNSKCNNEQSKWL